MGKLWSIFIVILLMTCCSEQRKNRRGERRNKSSVFFAALKQHSGFYHGIGGKGELIMGWQTDNERKMGTFAKLGETRKTYNIFNITEPGLYLVSVSLTFSNDVDTGSHRIEPYLVEVDGGIQHVCRGLTVSTRTTEGPLPGCQVSFMLLVENHTTFSVNSSTNEPLNLYMRDEVSYCIIRKET